MLETGCAGAVEKFLRHFELFGHLLWTPQSLPRAREEHERAKALTRQQRLKTWKDWVEGNQVRSRPIYRWIKRVDCPVTYNHLKGKPQESDYTIEAQEARTTAFWKSLGSRNKVLTLCYGQTLQQPSHL